MATPTEARTCVHRPTSRSTPVHSDIARIISTPRLSRGIARTRAYFFSFFFEHMQMLASKANVRLPGSRSRRGRVTLRKGGKARRPEIFAEKFRRFRSEAGGTRSLHGECPACLRARAISSGSPEANPFFPSRLFAATRQAA